VPPPAWAKQVTPDAATIAGSRYVVKPGDTLTRIANVTGASAEAIALENGLKEPFVVKLGQRLKIPGGRYHLVKRGESGIAIARAYGVDWSEVATMNHLQEPYLLREGQRLILPSAQEAANMTLEQRADAFKLDIDDIVTGGEPALAENAAPAPPTPTATQPVSPTVAVAPPPDSFDGRFIWPLEGKIVRNYPLDTEMAHLFGSAYGPPGLERTLFPAQVTEMPEAWQVLMEYRKPEPQNNDVRITIDHDLQAFVAGQLNGKKGAIVVVNPQTGDVLAMYSNPSYKISQVQYSTDYTALDGDQMDRPLLSRATREYYMPGSTFKTVTMMSAFRGGHEDFLGFDLPAPDCYTPYSGSKPICDSGGSCEICAANVGIRDAFKVSSNQYFAELANFLGRDRMGETARLLGIDAVEKPEEATLQGLFPDIWNTSDKRIANAIAPSRSVMVTGKSLSLYDFGIEGMGQGLASQMTPFQMALVASVPGNMQGRLMKPKIEFDQKPQPFSQVLSPQQAAEVRDIMSTVTEEAGGTGGVVKSTLAGTGIVAGGKTGTAQKSEVPIYDPKTGAKKFVLKKKKDANGNIVEYKDYLTYQRIDGWFICIAPLENPQVAIAVVIEDIGSKFGGGTAAPIAANVILKSRSLGLLGDKYTPKTPAAQTPRRRTR